MNDLDYIFNDTLDREGIDITINGIEHKVFFRKNKQGETDSYLTMYANVSDSIDNGNTFTMNNKSFLVLKTNTEENSTYKKYDVVECNQSVKIIYGKGNIISYPMFASDIKVSQLTKDNTITSASRSEFILSLDESSKLITINKRFFSGFFGLAFKIDDINYKNGLCYLYAERDVTNSNDDTTNGIADRWEYEDKPASYVVSISEDSVSIVNGKTATLTVSVTKNGTAISPTPTLTYTIGDSSVCSIDASTNTINSLKVGSTTIRATYKPNEYDTCTSDTVSVTVTEPVIVADITVSPAYNDSTYYGLTQYDDVTFSCTCGTSPSWNITLNSNGIPTSYYTSEIDNSKGTFHVTNNKMYSGKYLVYTISDSTSGKTATYQIALKGYM